MCCISAWDFKLLVQTARNGLVQGESYRSTGRTSSYIANNVQLFVPGQETGALCVRTSGREIASERDPKNKYSMLQVQDKPVRSSVAKLRVPFPNRSFHHLGGFVKANKSISLLVCSLVKLCGRHCANVPFSRVVLFRYLQFLYRSGAPGCRVGSGRVGTKLIPHG